MTMDIIIHTWLHVHVLSMVSCIIVYVLFRIVYNYVILYVRIMLYLLFMQYS